MGIFEGHFRLAEGVDIPAVGFGTYLVAPEAASDAVRTAISLGYRHVDTAAIYANELEVGAGIRVGMAETGLRREDLFVTTKLWPGMAEWGDTPKNRAGTLAAFDESLAKLGLDYVDLYLIHSPHGGTERLAQWDALVEIKRSGRARSIGVSNYGIAHLDEIRAAELAVPDANQIELHPWSQKPQLVSYMTKHGISPIAYSSLAPLSTWRIEPGQDSAKTEAMRSETAVFAELAAHYGVSEAQLLLRWGLEKGYAVLPKSLNPDRMRANIDLGGFAISEADMMRLAAMDRGDGLAWSTGDPSRAD